MDKQQLYIFIIMILCGIIGGIAVHITTFIRNDNKKLFNINCLEKILYGIISSLLVPLFLNTISSSLMDKIGTDIQSIFIFIGFCLIASLSSKLFIATLTEKTINSLQKQQNDTNKKVNNINNAIEPIVVKNMDPPVEINSDILKMEKTERHRVLSFGENKLLLAFGNNENTFFNRRSLAEKTELAQISISRMLKEMIAKKLVNVTHINNNVNYGLSFYGMKKYVELFNSIEWKVKLVRDTYKRTPLAIYDVTVESEYGEYNLNVYSNREKLTFAKGDTIFVQSVDGKKVDINYVKVKTLKTQ